MATTIEICVTSLLILFIDFRGTMHVFSQLDTSICSPNLNDTAYALPMINNTYMARMEWKILEQKKWVYIEEYFDGPRNRAALRLTGLYDPGKVALFISDYSTDEYFTVQDNVCDVTKLSTSDTFALPFLTVNGTSDQVLSVHKALKFGHSYREKYIGSATVRNISALYWESCIYDNTTQQTIKLGYYFSDSGSGWNSPSGAAMVPLRNTIHRKIGTGMDSFESHEQYDFVFFQEYIDDTSVFQIPSGIYCNGRHSTQAPPNIPSYFSFRAEMIVPKYQSIGAYDEWYDYTRKLVRIDSQPMQGGVVIVPTVARKDVHDFNAGVSYMLNLDTGVCNVVPLSTDIFDSKLLDPNHIAIKSPKGFFDFTSGDFIYSGQKIERSITMDTWIGKRGDFPPGLNKTSYWEWYFSSNNWLISEIGPPIRRAPMRLKISIPDVNTTFIYNIFDFAETEPDIRDFDVSFCYEDETIRDFKFSLIGNAWAISPRPKLFKYNTALALAQVMRISYIRVQVMRADFDNKGAYIVFRLLDLPAVKGDVSNPVNRVSSADAANGLRLVMDKGTFKFQSTINKPTTGSQTYTYTGVPGSLTEVVIYPNGTTVDIRDLTTSGSSLVTSGLTSTIATTRRPVYSPSPAVPTPMPPSSTTVKTLSSSQNGWHGGSVAGIAIGMTLIGLLLGAISTFLLLKFKERSYDLKEHLTMERME